jgi:hypothetical protein
MLKNGYKIQIITEPKFQELWSNVTDLKIDIVLVHPLDFSRAFEKKNIKADKYYRDILSINQ